MPAIDPDPLADLPTTVRIDLGIAVISAMPVQRDGGWSVAELADLCGCTEAAIYARQRDALRSLRSQMEALCPDIKDLFPRQ